MRIGEKTAVLVAIFLVFGAVFSPAYGDTITVGVGTGGNAADWLVTVYGKNGTVATNQTSYQVISWISFTSNAFRTGQWVSGADNKHFNGLWVAASTFELPEDASDASLVFSNFIVDDRAVLEINGHRVGASALAGTGPGKITYPVTGNQSVIYGTTSGDISEYLVRGTNAFTIIVNNTCSAHNLSAKTRNLNGNYDMSAVTVDITFSYVENVVPEPATIAMLALGGLMMLRRYIRAK